MNHKRPQIGRPRAVLFAGVWALGLFGADPGEQMGRRAEDRVRFEAQAANKWLAAGGAGKGRGKKVELIWPSAGNLALCGMQIGLSGGASASGINFWPAPPEVLAAAASPAGPLMVRCRPFIGRRLSNKLPSGPDEGASEEAAGEGATWPGRRRQARQVAPRPADNEGAGR